MPELFDDFLFGARNVQDIRSKDFYRETFDDFVATGEVITNSDAPPVITSWLASHLETELAYLNEYDRCAYCGAQYQRKRNIATHQCKFHPYPGYGPTNECCQRPKSAFGCTPCDHKPTRSIEADRWERANASISIPLYLRHVFAFPDAHIKQRYQDEEIPAKSYIVVHRVGTRPKVVQHISHNIWVS